MRVQASIPSVVVPSSFAQSSTSDVAVGCVTSELFSQRHVKTRESGHSTLRGRRNKTPCGLKPAASQPHCFIAD